LDGEPDACSLEGAAKGGSPAKDMRIPDGAQDTDFTAAGAATGKASHADMGLGEFLSLRLGELGALGDGSDHWVMMVVLCLRSHQAREMTRPAPALIWACSRKR
jgi:hypothetical protein